jgi:hypothetical protein
MLDFPQLTSSSSIYIEIIHSTLTTNLILFDTLYITHDYQQDLILNPGEFSFDLNTITFNKNVDYKCYYNHNKTSFTSRIGIIHIIVELIWHIFKDLN